MRRRAAAVRVQYRAADARATTRGQHMMAHDGDAVHGVTRLVKGIRCEGDRQLFMALV